MNKIIAKMKRDFAKKDAKRNKTVKMNKTAASELEERIKANLADFSDEELKEVVSGINGYYGDFPDLDFRDMEYEFDELHSGVKPLEIAERIQQAGDDFKASDDYWLYDSNNELVSYTESEVKELIHDSLYEIVEYLAENEDKKSNMFDEEMIERIYGENEEE